MGLLLANSHANPREAATIASFDIDLPGPPAQNEPERKIVEVAPQLPLPLVLPPPFVPTENEVVAALLEQAASSPAGGCDLTEPVQAALRLNPVMAQKLPLIADDRMSVARALGVWKDTWAEADEQLPAPVLETIRDTVRQTILAASDDCRFQIQTGPRLIYLPQEAQTITLALGSGDWTWQQVADTADPEFMIPGASVAPQDWAFDETPAGLWRAFFDGSDGSNMKARPIAEQPRRNQQQERTAQ